MKLINVRQEKLNYKKQTPIEMKKGYRFLLHILKSKKCGRGFTIIEMLVAIAVFSIALVAICGIFLSITKSQRKNSIDQDVQSEMSYALETITQAIRRYNIDYNTSINNPAFTLVLVRQDKESVSFFRGSDNRLKMQIGTGAAQDILSDKVKVDDLKFWITPTTDPFVPGGENEQPRVTILLGLSQSKNTTKPEEQASMRVQTTITQRVYKR